ncbi:MAG: hypothetical protein V2B20_21160 [Pseudomonadota bacterium]
MEDFAKALAYEVKQEIANRYFGFRTRIENQSKEYLANLLDAGQKYAAPIQLDLCRLQFLLDDPLLFNSFLNLAHLPRHYALYLCNQSLDKGQELFSAVHGKGFTRWRRFRNLAILIYHSLVENITAYNNSYLQLQEDHTEICMEIDKFQRQNDLSDILSFLRNLDSKDSDRLNFLHSSTVFTSEKTLNEALQIAPPPSVTEMMIMLTPLPPLEEIKGQFTELLQQAFTRHVFSNPSTLPF